VQKNKKTEYNLAKRSISFLEIEYLESFYIIFLAYGPTFYRNQHHAILKKIPSWLYQHIVGKDVFYFKCDLWDKMLGRIFMSTFFVLPEILAIRFL